MSKEVSIRARARISGLDLYLPLYCMCETVNALTRKHYAQPHLSLTDKPCRKYYFNLILISLELSLQMHSLRLAVFMPCAIIININFTISMFAYLCH